MTCVTRVTTAAGRNRPKADGVPNSKNICAMKSEVGRARTLHHESVNPGYLDNLTKGNCWPNMKFSVPALAVLFISLSATAGPQTSATDTYAVKYNLGVIEGWRVTPEAVTGHCKKIDPDGVAVRNKNLDIWQKNNAELILKIKTNFENAVPLVSPARNSLANPVEAVRAIITIEAIKTLFLDKN